MVIVSVPQGGQPSAAVLTDQAFDNVILDQSVVLDTYHNAHGTISDDYADALVKSNPDRFQYVPTQDYWKGIDY